MGPEIYMVQQTIIIYWHVCPILASSPGLTVNPIKSSNVKTVEIQPVSLGQKIHLVAIIHASLTGLEK